MHRKRPYLVFSTILLYVVVALAGYAQAAPVQLTWDAATHNSDGTPLTDLAGYRIYYWQPEWEFPERVEVGTETSRTLTGLEVGKTYHFAVTAFNTEQRESVYSKDISVTIPVPASPPVADFSASPLEGVAPFTVTFTDTSTGDITGWLWDFADGIGSTLQHPTHTFMAAGTYTVSLTVTGPGGTDTITKGNVVTVTASDLKHLPVASVQASADDGNVPAHTLDGDPTTRWSAMGDGQWIEYDLGSVHSVGEVAIAWYKGDQRVAFFDLEVSSDGTTWTPVFSGQSSGTTLEPEHFTFNSLSVRYVRYVGFGNSSSAWNSVTDIGIYAAGPPQSPPTPTLLPVASVQASADDGNVPAHTLDGDPTTRWSAMGDGQWIEYDLGSVHSVGEVAIAWYKGDQRVAFFDLEVSSDGTTWTPVFSGQSSGTTLEPELFTFDPVEARYVRYVGFGNSSSAWNSVTDIGIWTP